MWKNMPGNMEVIIQRSIQKLRQGVTFLLVLILLPYVITVFANGPQIKEWNRKSEQYVQVRLNESKTEMVGEEEYFIGVLAKNIPSDYEQEAIAAQAVVLRTLLKKEIADKGTVSEEYVTSEELKKKGTAEQYQKMYQKYYQAMENTKHQVLLYKDTFANAAFHRSNAGSTRDIGEVLANGDCPYLCQVECPKDKKIENAIHIQSFSYEEILEKCRDFLVAVEKEEAERGYTFEDFEVIVQDLAGYVTRIRIGANEYSGEEFRAALELPSCAFTFQNHKGKLRITTIGNGHGYGMSQWTANEMAKDGAKWREILQYFYPGTTISEEKDF